MFAEEIRRNVSTYLDRFEHNGAKETDVRKQASVFLSELDVWNPEYAEELCGISEGSGASETEIAALNVRYEIMYATYSEQSAGTDGCTSFALLPEATDDCHTYVGQNWDWISPIGDTLVVTEVRPPDGSNHLGVTEAGIVGAKMGVNENGIGLAVNGLISPADGESPFRKPFHVRFREVLSAGRNDQALKPLIETPHACSANFVVAHGDGEAIDIEAAPNRCGYVYPDDGILTHSNHFRSRMERQLPDTLYRARRLHQLLERSSGIINQAAIESALTDHFGRPASVCRHVDNDAHRHERTKTNASVIIDLTEKTLSVAAGPPCESAYDTHQLE